MSHENGISTLGLTDAQFTELLRACEEVKARAYSVYSKFRVGSALLTAPGPSGEIFSGCNVENASYGLTVCAERSAICQAVAKGHHTFHCIAVTSDVTDKFCTPCGACRQFIAEFAPNVPVILMQPGRTMEQYLQGDGIKIITMSQLLPFGFSPADLQRPKVQNHP